MWVTLESYCLVCLGDMALAASTNHGSGLPNGRYASVTLAARSMSLRPQNTEGAGEGEGGLVLTAMLMFFYQDSKLAGRCGVVRCRAFFSFFSTRRHGGAA